jgi:hypothetical protein
MRRLSSISFFVLIVVLFSACEPAIVDAPTPTPETIEPTEVPAESPVWVVAPNGMWPGHTTYPELVGDRYVFHLSGNEGEGFAGFVGVRLENVELLAGQCYVFEFVNALLDLRTVPNEELTDISAKAFIHLPNGGTIELNKHAVFYKDGLEFVVTESPNIFWSFWSMTDVTLNGIDGGIDQQHANAKPGNVFSFESVAFYPVNDPGLCAGIPIS